MLRSALVIVGCVGFLPAQQFRFDTDPSPAIAISAEASVPVAGNRGWFRSHDASHDAGLYVIDGTLAGSRRVLDSWHELVGEFAGRLVLTMINNSK